MKHLKTSTSKTMNMNSWGAKLIRRLKIMKTLYGNHVYAYLLRIREGELLLRLQQFFTADEAWGILSEINNSDEHVYSQPGFTIMYSGISEAYSIFVTSGRYLKLTEDIGIKFCKPPKNTRSQIEDLILWDGSYLETEDVDYIMNCFLIVKENAKKARKTNAGLIVKLVKTLLYFNKKVTANIKIKDEMIDINKNNDKDDIRNADKQIEEIISNDDDN